MTDFAHDLPEGMFEWIAEAGGGPVTQLRRHLARREAWVVDVTRPDGSVLEGFLRLQRESDSVDPRRLERETRIIQALGRTDVPVPEVYAWNPELQATLFERDPGRSDVDQLDDSKQQRAVMEDFIRVVARMHTLDLDALGLDGVMQYKPTNATEAALNEVDLIASQWRKFLAHYHDPLTRYGLDWLRRFAPDSIARLSLVQGDTGPVNFMFQDDHVSAVIDWELGHYGDPLEDLGNIMVREFFNPSGGLDGLFELYERESGIPYDRFRARYYAVHQNVRGMIPIHYVCAHVHPRESVAWYLCYRYLGDRATTEMLAAAMDVPIERPEMPSESGEPDVLADAALYAQQHDVEPKLDDAFARSRSLDVQTLVRCIDRRRRYGALLDAEAIDDLGQLLGQRPATLAEGRSSFCAAIGSGKLEDDAVIQTLARQTYRDEWLYSPAVEYYPNRRWSPID